MGLFDGLQIAVDFGYRLNFKQKAEMRKKVVENGGTISYIVTKKCHFVVTSEPEKCDVPSKCRMAIKYGLPVLRLDYIWDSLQAEILLPHDSYVVGGESKSLDFKSGKISAHSRREKAKKYSYKAIFNPKTVRVWTVDDSNQPSFNEDGHEVAKNAIFMGYSSDSKSQYTTILELHTPPFQSDVKNQPRLVSDESNQKTQLQYRVISQTGCHKDLEAGKPCHTELRYVSTAEQALAVFAMLYDDIEKKADGIKCKRPIRGIGSQKLQKMMAEMVDVSNNCSDEVKELVEHIWREAMTEVTSLLGDINNIKLEDVEKAEAILLKVRIAIKSSSAEKTIQDLIGDFYSTLRHRNEKSDAEDRKRWLVKKQDMCQLIRDMKAVSEMTNYETRAYVEAKYAALMCRITLLRETQKDEIEDLIISSLEGAAQDLVVLNVYEVWRSAEDMDFRHDLSRKQLLFHSSKVENFVGILSRGLLLPKIVVDDFGGKRSDAGMLGGGIYFASAASTSVKYSSPSKTKGSRLLLVNEVALGVSKDCTTHNTSLVAPPEGYNSTHGVSKHWDRSSQFENDEFVVYSINQQRIRYLVEFTIKGDQIKPLKEICDVDTNIACDAIEKTSLQDVTGITDPMVKVKSGLISTGDEAVELRCVHIRAKLVDLAAQVVVLQEYYNNSQQAIEAKYVFPLDDTAAVCGFEAFINGKHIVGKVKEKETAHKEYKEAISEGHGAYLMDQDEQAHDVFTVSVGNLPSGACVLIKITYIAELEVEGEQISFLLPATVAPWKESVALKQSTQEELKSLKMRASKTTIQVAIEMPFDIRSLHSPTHKLRVKQTASKAYVEVINSHNFEAGFQLLIGLAEIHVPRMWVEQHPQNKEHQACMLTFYPEFDSKEATEGEMCLLLDMSNSMKGVPLSEAKKVALLVLQNLPRGWHFNLVRFGLDYEELWPAPRINLEENVQLAFNFVQNSVANKGNTGLMQPLRASFLLPHAETQRNVFLISDGHINDEEHVLRSASQNSGHTRLFSFGVSATCNTYTLKALSRVSGGAFEFFDSRVKSKWESKVKNQISKACQPGLTSVSVEWHQYNDNLPPLVQAPQQITALFSGSHQVVYGFVPDCTMATLKAFIDGQEVSTVVSTSELSITEGQLVHRLTARAVIRDWNDGVLSADRTKHEVAKMDLKNHIINLSKQYSIVTQFTSLIAVETRSENEKDLPKNGPSIDELVLNENLDFLDYIGWTIEPDDDISAVLSAIKKLSREVKEQPFSNKMIFQLEAAENKYNKLREEVGPCDTDVLKAARILIETCNLIGDTDRALNVAETAYKEAINNIDTSVEDSSYCKVADILVDIRDNIISLSGEAGTQREHIPLPKSGDGKIILRTPEGQDLTIPCHGLLTVAQLKEAIHGKELIPADHQQLSFKGKMLDYDFCLDDENIGHGDRIDMLINKKDVLTIDNTLSNPICFGMDEDYDYEEELSKIMLEDYSYERESRRFSSSKKKVSESSLSLEEKPQPAETNGQDALLEELQKLRLFSMKRAADSEEVELLPLKSLESESENLPLPKLSESLSLPRLSKNVSLSKLSENLSLPKLSENLSLQKLSEGLPVSKLSEGLSLPKLSESLLLPKLSESLFLPKLSLSIAGPSMSEPFVAPAGFSTDLKPQLLSTDILPHVSFTNSGVLQRDPAVGFVPESPAGFLSKTKTEGFVTQVSSIGFVPKAVPSAGSVPQFPFAHFGDKNSADSTLVVQTTSTGFVPKISTTGFVPQSSSTGLIPQIPTGFSQKVLSTGLVPQTTLSTGFKPQTALFTGFSQQAHSASCVAQTTLSAGFVPQIAPSAGFVPQTRLSAGFVPQTAPPTGFVPQTAPPTGFVPQTAPSTGFVPQTAPSTGFVPQTAPSTGFVPQTARSTGFVPQTAPSTAFVPQTAPSTGFVPQTAPSTGFVSQTAPSTACVPQTRLSAGFVPQIAPPIGFPKQAHSTGFVPQTLSTGFVPQKTYSKGFGPQTGLCMGFMQQAHSIGFVPQTTLSAGFVPQTTLSAGFVPQTTLSAGFVPQTTLSAGFVPQTTLSAGFVPQTTLSAGFVPQTTLSAGFVPQTTLSAGFVPQTTLSAGFVPQTTLSAGFVPQTTLSAGFVPWTATSTASCPLVGSSFSKDLVFASAPLTSILSGDEPMTGSIFGIFGSAQSDSAQLRSAQSIDALSDDESPHGSLFESVPTPFGDEPTTGVLFGSAPTPGSLLGSAPTPGLLLGSAPNPGSLLGSAPNPGSLLGSAPTSSSLFGSAPASNTLFGSAPTAGLLFGNVPTTGVVFGDSALTSTLFGSSALTSTLFGSSAPSTLFGSSAPSTLFGSSAPTSTLFGSSAPTSTLFGSSAPSTLFGSSAPSTSTLFGSSAPSTSTLFGSSAPTSTLFGSSAPSTSFGSSAPTSTLFGSSAPSTSTLFGSSAPSTSTLFGSSAPTSTLFGSSAPSTSFGSSAPTSTLFGSSAPTSTLFGSSAPSTLFGSSAPTSTLFGSSAPSTLFGSSAPTSTLFGSSAPSTSTLFGSSAPTSTLFGSSAPTSTLFGSSAPSTSTLFGSSAPSTSTLFGSSAPTSTLFGSSAPSTLFGSSAPTSTLFGSSAPSTSTLFGSSAPSTLFGSSAPTSTLFGSSAPSTLFGSSAPSTLFGSSAPTSTLFGSSAPSTLFGSSAPSTLFGSSAPTSTLFGSSAPTSTLFGSSAPSTLFGSSAPTSTLFGSSAPSTLFGSSAPTSTLFGSSAPSTLFGSSAPSTLFGSSAPTSTLFGSSAPTSTLFGSSAPSTLFGSSAPTSTLFGSSAPSTLFGSSAPSTSFGSSAPTSTLFGSSAPTSTLFGSSAPTSTLFGSSAPTSTLFGSSAPSTLFGSSAPSTSTLFGGSAPPTSTLFGGSAQPTSLFGSSAPSTLFGGSAQPTSLFGSSAPSTLFGSSAPSTSTLFGGSAPPTSTLFGGSAQPTSLFGSSAPSTLFGGSAPPTSALFGGSVQPISALFGGSAPPTSTLFGGSAPSISSLTASTTHTLSGLAGTYISPFPDQHAIVDLEAISPELTPREDGMFYIGHRIESRHVTPHFLVKTSRKKQEKNIEGFGNAAQTSSALFGSVGHPRSFFGKGLTSPSAQCEGLLPILDSFVDQQSTSLEEWQSQDDLISRNHLGQHYGADVNLCQENSGQGVGHSLKSFTMPLKDDGKPCSPPLKDDGKPCSPPLKDDGKPCSLPLKDDGKPCSPPLKDDGKPCSLPLKDNGKPCSLPLKDDGKPCSGLLKDDGKPCSPPLNDDWKPCSLPLKDDGKPCSPPLNDDRVFSKQDIIHNQNSSKIQRKNSEKCEEKCLKLGRHISLITPEVSEELGSAQKVNSPRAGKRNHSLRIQAHSQSKKQGLPRGSEISLFDTRPSAAGITCIRDSAAHLKLKDLVELLECQNNQGFWELNSKLDDLLGISFEKCQRILKASGLHSLGKTATQHIEQLMATILVLFSILELLKPELFPIDKSLDAELPQKLHHLGVCYDDKAWRMLDLKFVRTAELKVAMNKAFEFCLRIEGQHPLVYFILELGTNWVNVAAAFLQT